MNERTIPRELGQVCRISIAVTIIFLMFFAASAQAEQLSESAILGEADARIDKYRKADGEVRVVDADGKPVADVTLQIEQTRHAFLFGCNIFRWNRCNTPEQNRRYECQFAEVFNYATLPFYWWWYEPQQGQPQYDQSEQVARWCKQQGIATKGHPLAWNYTELKWLPDDPQKILSLQIGRIRDCMKRFSRLDRSLGTWSTRWRNTTGIVLRLGRRNTPVLGSRSVRSPGTKRCFEAARAASLTATLLINDFDVTPAYEKVIEQLVDAKGKHLYDVIGIQSHMHGGIWPDKKIWEVCERFSRFGAPLHFTETTLVSGELGWDLPASRPGFKWESTPDGLKRQAEQTQRFYTILFSHPAVEAITWWDFTDQIAWQKAPAGWLDADLQPKPVYDAMHKLIREKWWTRLDTRTNATGQATFRGFKGTYRATVRLNDGRTFSGEFELPATAPWRFAIPRNQGQ